MFRYKVLRPFVFYLFEVQCTVLVSSSPPGENVWILKLFLTREGRKLSGIFAKLQKLFELNINIGSTTKVNSHQFCVFILDLKPPAFFFSIWVFFHEHSRFTGQQGKGEGIYLTPLYHFHPLHRHLDISRAIAAESSPLHIVGSRTRTRNLWFPSASR